MKLQLKQHPPHSCLAPLFQMCFRGETLYILASNKPLMLSVPSELLLKTQAETRRRLILHFTQTPSFFLIQNVQDCWNGNNFYLRFKMCKLNCRIQS